MCWKCYFQKPTSSAQAPPFNFKNYVGMANFQSWLRDTIVRAIDLERIDHQNGKYDEGLEIREKVSEVGLSYIDLRDTHFTYKNDSSTEQLSTNSKLIVSHHTIINRWRNFTEETCDAPHHKRLGKPHTAMPYHCMEMEADKHRVVVVLYWDARMEVNWFYDMEYWVGWCGALEWDFQKFQPFRSTFERAKTGAGAAFPGLGVCGESADDATVLHNAANDTFSQLVAFLRFMRNQELRPRFELGEAPQEVEDLDPEHHEPVVVRQSAMAEINAGYTSTTVGSAPEPNSWAAALRKPVEKVPEFKTLWSLTWTSTFGDSWDWRPTKTWWTADDCEESVEKEKEKEEEHVKLATKTSIFEVNSTQIDCTSSSSGKKAEESEWTVVATQKPQAKKAKKHVNKPNRPVKPYGQLVKTHQNSKTGATTAQPLSYSKPVSTEKTASNKPRPFPEQSSAAIHWAKFRPTGSEHVR
ncbi:hypothetical protein QBC32DRAFT_401958 [Pseudoneurospora amorphoporcata]|uniref:Uncharacterized protein n=1 Tax=Pseudoneurospora amorphoporcata TaxID=241081 RepID=A0AAN6NJ35_9PEZI|nr:hypothetical protein QBC32DRAFT_401958 [Pseudoneurospora amorphoporcata]